MNELNKTGTPTDVSKPPAEIRTVSIETHEAEIAKLNAELNNVRTELAKTQKELNDVNSVNSDLQSEIEKLSSGAALPNTAGLAIHPSDHSFEHDGKRYGFNYGVQMVKGKRVTPAEVKADAELQAHLVATGSSMIKEI